MPSKKGGEVSNKELCHAESCKGVPTNMLVGKQA